MTVTLAQRGREESFTAPFQVPLGAPGYPLYPLLGREPLFHLFDVRFQHDFTERLGKFTLSKVTRRRPASSYTVGGRPI